MTFKAGGQVFHMLYKWLYNFAEVKSIQLKGVEEPWELKDLLRIQTTKSQYRALQF